MKAALLCLVVMAYLLADSTTAQGSTFEIKCGVEELKQDVISRIDTVEGKLDNVEGKLDNVEGKLDNVVEKLDELQVQHHDGVEELKQDVISRIDTVDGKLDDLKQLLAKVITSTSFLFAVKLQADSAILSSIHSNFPASKCIDRNTGNYCHTNKEKYPWLALDLGKSVRVSSVTIYNRQDCCGDRLQDLEIRISDNLPTTLATESFKGGAKLGFFEGPGKNGGEVIEMVAERPLAGRYVVLMNNSKGRHGADFLNLAEVTCMGYS